MHHIKKIVKWASIQGFLLGDRVGIHVLPKRYYTPIPNYAWLAKNQPLWARRTDMTGLDWNLDQQAAWLQSTCQSHIGEVEGFCEYDVAVKKAYGPGYGPVESQVLHCFVRSFNPRKIIEVGSGVSTACIISALERNKKENRNETSVFCVEPYPQRILSSLPGVSVQKKLVQEVESSFFDQLESGDLLFIDSSHAVKTGSDVLYLYLDIIPNLKPGVFIHIHDIFLPYVYQRDVLHSYFCWQETALLLALLKCNTRLKVSCCLSALHYERRDDLSRIIPDYNPQLDVGEGLSGYEPEGHFPSSIWLQTI